LWERRIVIPCPAAAKMWRCADNPRRARQIAERMLRQPSRFVLGQRRARRPARSCQPRRLETQPTLGPTGATHPGGWIGVAPGIACSRSKVLLPWGTR
jgi:hypothetical protein